MVNYVRKAYLQQDYFLMNRNSKAANRPLNWLVITNAILCKLFRQFQRIELETSFDLRKVLAKGNAHSLRIDF